MSTKSEGIIARLCLLPIVQVSSLWSFGCVGLGSVENTKDNLLEYFGFSSHGNIKELIIETPKIAFNQD